MDNVRGPSSHNAPALPDDAGSIDAFDFRARTRIVCGEGRLDMLGELAEELDARRVLVVSDPGVIAAGHTERGIAALDRAGLATLLFKGVHENPTTDDVDRGLVVAKAFRPDLIVGLGGGSSMDCAKGINFLYSCGGRMQDYWGVGKATRPMLPMIAVPTTAGTGSEAQSFALITDATTHKKMACGDKKAAFRIALLDPTLTLTQPAAVTAMTGIDAMAHAIETYVTTRRNAVSQMFSREAWRRIARSFAIVLDAPDDQSARRDMQLGACFAGMAIENSMLGATHALANPLTARYGIVHGQAIGLLLPHVIRFNGPVCDRSYGEILRWGGATDGNASTESGADRLAQFVARLAAKAGLDSRLSACGVEKSRLGDLAAEASREWTGTFNPRKVDEASLLAIYQAAW